MLSDIFPTGYHGAIPRRRDDGLDGLRRWRGPVGLAAAYSAQLLGAAVVIVGDLKRSGWRRRGPSAARPRRLRGTPLEEQIAGVLGIPEVDCAVDAVGFEASGHGRGGRGPGHGAERDPD